MRKSAIVLISGIVLWAIVLVIELARSAPSNVIWICISGIIMGLLGLRYSIRRLRRERTPQ